MLTFIDAVMLCLKDEVFVAEFNRLFDCSVGEDDRSNIEKLVDDATGHDPLKNDMLEFIDFVLFVIWIPLVTSNQ